MKGCASPVSGPRHHFVALDSLRGVAACLVVLHHIPGEGLLIGSEFVRNGWLAVDFFFVLSGFIIAANYANRLACGFSRVQFWIYRLGRLWPLHVAVLAVSVMVEGSGLLFDSSALISRLPFTEGRSPDNLLFSAFLLQAWQGEGGNGWNVQSWSISVEVFLYLIFGLAWAWMGRAASALLAFGVVVWATCFDLSGWLGNDLFARVCLVSPPACWCGKFASGCRGSSLGSRGAVSRLWLRLRLSWP